MSLWQLFYVPVEFTSSCTKVYPKASSFIVIEATASQFKAPEAHSKTQKTPGAECREALNPPKAEAKETLHPQPHKALSHLNARKHRPSSAMPALSECVSRNARKPKAPETLNHKNEGPKEEENPKPLNP